MKLVSWNTTNRCNLFCKHCYRDAKPEDHSAEELSTAEGLKLIGEMKKAGFETLVFSGGEPMLREDIYALLERAKEVGLVSVFGTNGTLITPENAPRLKEAGLFAAAVSLDSIDPEKHNEFRGSPTAFEDALKGIGACISAEIKVQINCTVTKGNMDEVEKILDYAESLGAAMSHMLFLVEVGRGKNLSHTTLTRAEYKDTLDRILQKGASMRLRTKPTCAPQYKVEAKLLGLDDTPGGQRGCIAGVAYASVLPNGDVHICPYAQVKVASVRDLPFDEIWANNEVFKKLRDFSAYHGKCGRCRYVGICGGCRARAWKHTGDWLGEDPYCLLEEGMDT